MSGGGGEFGENIITQTTLASMFPISYSTMISQFMSPSTPDPNVPLAPEKVRSLITAPFSLTYSGDSLSIQDLNTELTFLARSLCSPSKPGADIGPSSLLINLTFTNISSIENPNKLPLVIQGIILEDSLIFSTNITPFSSIQIGLCIFARDLLFDSDFSVGSLEIFSCTIGRNLTLPSSSSLETLLIYGQYPQITLEQLSNTKVYPNLTSLLYLNGFDGKSSSSARDIPKGAIGFGAFTLDGLTQSSYPWILTLALPNPWKYDIESLFPNLMTLYSLGISDVDESFVVPATKNSRYDSLILIDAAEMKSLDLSQRVSFLTEELRIIGCPLLTGILLSNNNNTTTPLAFSELVIQRCGLVYLRGADRITRTPLFLSLGDHVSPPLEYIGTTPKIRILDYVLGALPEIFPGVAAVAKDYLPNVISSLADTFPSLVLYPVMQTVDYTYTRPPSLTPSTTFFTQYNGGTNPVVPFPTNALAATLTNASISVSPFSLRYTIRVTTTTSSSTNLATLLGTTTTSNRIKEIPHSKWIFLGILITAFVFLIIGITIVVVRRQQKKDGGSSLPEQPRQRQLDIIR